MGVTESWMGFVYRSIVYEPAASHAQERKFMEGLSWKIPGPVWKKGCKHKLSNLGYSDTGTKMSQLKRDYINHDSIMEAREAFKTRKDQSVTSWCISTIGAVKTNAQGHCIRNVIVSYHSPRVTESKEPRLTIDILYRTTELLRKFGADLIFLGEELIPEILEDSPWEKEPDEIRMYFPSCFFSALFIPVFYQYVNPIRFLKQLKEVQGNTIFYRRCLYRTKTLLEKEPDSYKFASRRNMAEFAQNRLILSGKIDKQKVQGFIRKEETS